MENPRERGVMSCLGWSEGFEEYPRLYGDNPFAVPSDWANLGISPFVRGGGAGIPFGKGDQWNIPVGWANDGRSVVFTGGCRSWA